MTAFPDKVRTIIAIVPTACGIETGHYSHDNYPLNSGRIAIVPTACGIETVCSMNVATPAVAIAIVPTACGIETFLSSPIH